MLNYWAFISYSSSDRKWGTWLRKRLENFPIPEDLQGQEFDDGAVLGKHLRPVFRDRDELPGSNNLGARIQEALQESRYLIVLCSPHSAQSAWVNKEIEEFRAMGKGEAILALILNGEPNSNDPATECFPPALQYPHEPIAGDLRSEGDGKERGFLKIIAGIAELDFDQIYRRHERAQRRRRLVLSVLSIAIMMALGGLALVAMLQKEEAERQKAQADTERNRAEVLLGNVGRSVFLLAEDLNRTGSANMPARVAMDQIIEDLSQYGGEQPWVEHAKGVAATALANAHLQQGLNYRPAEAAKKMEEAVSSFEKASQSEPDNLFLLKEHTKAYLELGRLYTLLEKENAEPILKKGLSQALDLRKRAPLEMASGLLVRDAHTNLGRYYVQLGQKAEAIAHCESAIQAATAVLNIPPSPQINFSPMERQRYFQERQALERSIAWLTERVDELNEGKSE